MRTILSGQVAARHLDDARLLMDIRPTHFLMDGTSALCADTGLPVTTLHPCVKQPAETRLLAVNCRLVYVEDAEAVVCVGSAPEQRHLCKLALERDLLVYWVEE